MGCVHFMLSGNIVEKENAVFDVSKLYNDVNLEKTGSGHYQISVGGNV